MAQLGTPWAPVAQAFRPANGRWGSPEGLRYRNSETHSQCRTASGDHRLRRGLRIIAPRGDRSDLVHDSIDLLLAVVEVRRDPDADRRTVIHHEAARLERPRDEQRVGHVDGDGAGE